MFRWLGITGFLCWLAGTATLFVAMSWGVVSQKVELYLPDGTPIRGVLYRPRTPGKDLPVVVVLHATALAHRSCVPGLVIPLAQNGYAALAIDLQGHGDSGGSLPRSQLDDGLAILSTFADHPEVDAAIDFIKQQPFPARQHPLFLNDHCRVVKPCIALVGHSRGGWAAADVGYRRDDIDSVVSIGIAPGTCDLDRPRNFLMLTGKQERLCPVEKCIEAISRATGGALRHPGVPFGHFMDGTARRLLLVSGLNHVTELTDPAISRRVVQWLGASFDFDAGQVPGDWLTVVLIAVVAATLGGLIACNWTLAGLVAWLFPSPAVAIHPGRIPHLVLFFVLVILVVPGAGLLATWVEVGPAYFAGPSVVLLALVATACLGSASTRKRDPGEPGRAPSSVLWKGVGLGGIALALSFVWFGLPWGMSWFDLVPSPRRLVLALALLPLLFPWSLALAHGLQRLLGNAATGKRIALGAFTWLAIPLAFWVAHRFIALGQGPLFIVPLGLLGVSFLVPLPLWLLPDRGGMSLARAVSHAGGAAWLLACHLPFVHAG